MGSGHLHCSPHLWKQHQTDATFAPYREQYIHKRNASNCIKYQLVFAQVDDEPVQPASFCLLPEYMELQAQVQMLWYLKIQR